MTEEEENGKERMDLNRKRERMDENEDGDGGNGDESKKIVATERFRKMGISELRERARLSGILTTGSKKELLERLCSNAEKQSSNMDDMNLQGANLWSILVFIELNTFTGLCNFMCFELTYNVKCIGIPYRGRKQEGEVGYCNKEGSCRVGPMDSRRY